MSERDGLDCIVIGYNEAPFESYEETLRAYGEESPAYQDLKFNFVDLVDDGRKLDFVGLLNHAADLAAGGPGAVDPADEFRSGDIPNLGAVYLTNFVRMQGGKSEYVNLFQHEKQKLVELLKRRPVCVAITTTYYVVNFPVQEIVQFIRQHDQDVKIVVGGPLVGNHVRRFTGESLGVALKDLGADIYVDDSQGESALWNIVQCLKQGGRLEDVSNLVFFDETDALRVTPRVPECNSLDQGSIDWRRFSANDLGQTIQLRTGRGCAFRCAFCGYPTRAGKLALAELGTVERELDSIASLGNVTNVAFVDDTFNIPLKRFKQVCRLMIDKKYPFDWYSYFRCGNADEEAIELMAESGCKGVFLGIESGSPTILKNMHKAATVEKYTRGIELLRHHGILTFASFIIGFPGETEQTVDETIQFIDATRPDFYRAQMWYSEAGAPIDLQRDDYDISGQGFNWRHKTMNSTQAMDEVRRLFTTVQHSTWMPQWSFDFWIVPYLVGRGLSLAQFKRFMTPASRLLALEFKRMPRRKKAAAQQGHIDAMVDALRDGRAQAEPPRARKPGVACKALGVPGARAAGHEADSRSPRWGS